MGLLDDIDDDALSANSAVLRRTIPGYDYRSRDAWSETDRTLREKLERDLGAARGVLKDASDACYDDDRRDDVAAIGDLTDDVETFARRVENAGGDGGGLREFSADEESDLVAVVEHDATLVEDGEDLVTRAEKVRAAARTGAPITDELHACRSLFEDVERAFDRRQDYLHGLK
ncbi:MAG: hypothetical protein ABEI96_07025 [Haloarculaceae archaeon]